jgi:NTP pyrophosphatase (non-canonical NTP hydrolase)
VGSPNPLASSWEFDPTNGADQQTPTARGQHKGLKRADRLQSLVQCLSIECPWTQSTSPETMLTWLKSECSEVKVEMKQVERVLAAEAEGTSPETPGFKEKLKLQRELGDILFDACSTCERRPERHPERPSASATPTCVSQHRVRAPPQPVSQHRVRAGSGGRACEGFYKRAGDLPRAPP